MEITLNITEDSKVELIKDNCEAVQGENNVTILNINFPSTIKGYSIDNYTKQIEFGECKELGECKKFFDVLNGNSYKLCSTCTQFEKIMIQFTLKNLIDEAEPIIWKSMPFALEFCESINAENAKEVQATLLSLVEIKAEWENYIKSNTLRMIYKVGDVPTANATSVGDTIFYLGANSTDPYTLTYGHYYRCNYVNDAYEWTDLTQDPSLADVANGVREINKNQTMQFWLGTKEELENEAIQDNVAYVPIDQDIKQSFDEVLTEMAEDETYNLAYPIKDDEGAPTYHGAALKRQLFAGYGEADGTNEATIVPQNNVDCVSLLIKVDAEGEMFGERAIGEKVIDNTGYYQICTIDMTPQYSSKIVSEYVTQEDVKVHFQIHVTDEAITITDIQISNNGTIETDMSYYFFEFRIYKLLQ